MAALKYNIRWEMKHITVDMVIKKFAVCVAAFIRQKDTKVEYIIKYSGQTTQNVSTYIKFEGYNLPPLC